MVKTSGFHPDNSSSILLGDGKAAVHATDGFFCAGIQSTKAKDKADSTSARRIKGNFSRKLLKYERLASDHKPTGEELSAILSSVNSYLGIMRHFATKRFRVGQLLRHFSDRLKQHFSFKGDGLKIEKRK